MNDSVNWLPITLQFDEYNTYRVEQGIKTYPIWDEKSHLYAAGKKRIDNVDCIFVAEYIIGLQTDENPTGKPVRASGGYIPERFVIWLQGDEATE